MKAEREVVEETICCCVMIRPKTGQERVCENLTSGPDDPFCDNCTERHHDVASVMSGYEVVTARLPEPAS